MSDVAKVLKIDIEIFDEYRNNVESIGGLATEINGKVPHVGSEITFENLILKVESADRKKVRRVKVSFVQEDDQG